MSAASIVAPAGTHAVTVATNLVIAAQCLFIGTRLRRLRGTAGTREWSRFFLLMSLATLTGAVKHGATDAHPAIWFGAVLAYNPAGAAAIAFAQLATVSAFVRNATVAASLRRAIAIQAVLPVVATVLRPGFLPALLDTIAGLAPVLVAHALAARRCRAGAGAIATGLGFMALGGAAYVLGLAIPPWLDPVGLAHLVSIAGFGLIGRGVAGRRRPTALPAARIPHREWRVRP